MSRYKDKTARVVWSMTRTVAPANRVVDLVAIKKQLRLTVEDDYHDQTIVDLIDGATAQVEHDTTLSLMRQTWELHRDSWGCDRWIQIPVRPVIEVTSLTCETDGVPVVVDPATYKVDKARQQIVLNNDASWPTADFGSIVATVVAGFGDSPLHAPADLRQAINLQVSKWFSNAGVDMNEIVFGNDAAYERLVGRYMRSDYP